MPAATRARGPRVKVPAGAKYDPVQGDRAVRFFERFLRHQKGRWAGRPFVLEPWQADDIVRPLFGTVDAKTGLRWYREALVGLPRKNGKSELAAGIALYLLIADGEHGAEVYSVAGDKKQAGLVYKTAADMVRASAFRTACKVYRSVLEVPETNGLYRVLSADADLQHGLNPHGAVVDEYHIHRNAEQYEALRSGTGAREQPLILVITTAASEKRGPLFELYERGKAGTNPRAFFYWRGVPPGTPVSDLAAFKQANPASWITEAFLAEQAASLPEPVFRRLHGNEWWEGSRHMWVPREAWDACAGPVELELGHPTVVAVDAASRRDTTALALVQKHGEEYRCRVWIMRADEEVGYLDYQQVENLLRDLASTYDVRRIGFDPYQMVPVAQRLDAEGLPVELFPQSHTRMVPASMLLYDLVREGRLRHDGDPDVTDQVLSAGVSEVAQGWRLDKRKGNRSIDSAIALAMACQMAKWEDEYSAPTVLVI